MISLIYLDCAIQCGPNEIEDLINCICLPIDVAVSTSCPLDCPDGQILTSDCECIDDPNTCS